MHLLDWTTAEPLARPIQTRAGDVLFSGRGVLTTTTSGGTTVVPPGMAICFLGPEDSAVSYELGQALGTMKRVGQLGLKQLDSPLLSPVAPQVYVAGEEIPNYVLLPHSYLSPTANGPHLIGVREATTLANLWQRAKPFQQADTILRCFWITCKVLALAQNPVVCHR